MWNWQRGPKTLDLEPTAYARCWEIDRSGDFRWTPGYTAWVLDAQVRRADTRPDGTARLAAGTKLLLVRHVDVPRIEFDSLRAKDRCLMALGLEIRLRSEDAGRFQALLMTGRDDLQRDELTCLVKERLKYPVRGALRRYRADSLDGDPNVRRSLEQSIRSGGELASWAEQHGLLVESISLTDCCPALDPLAIKVELERAKSAGQAALEEMLERMHHDQTLLRHQRLSEILDSQVKLSQKVEELLALCDHWEQRDRRRCQQCHAFTEEGFHCCECGRWLCSIHESEQGVCRNCRAERRREQEKVSGEEVYKCPISGHFVVRTATFECPRCQTIACEHCYDPATRQCVRCAAAAAQQTEDSPRRAVSGLLAALRTLPQLRDLRLWCDSRQRVCRGVGVAPRSDVRVFHLGDDIRFQYLAEFDGFLRLIAVQSDGTSVPLFPNERCADYRIEGGRVRSFPEPGEDFRYFAQQPAGLDTIVAVLSPAPFRLWADDPLLPDDGPAPPSSQRVQGETATRDVLQTIQEQVANGTWSCADCQLLVQP